MDNHYEDESDEFNPHEEVECSDECSMLDGQDPWVGPLSECAEKEQTHYGQKVMVAVCPKCGEDIRYTGGGSSWASDPDRKAERQQMGITD